MAKTDKKTGGGPTADPAERARRLNRIIFALALFGILVTVHLWIQSERGFSRGCFGLDDPEDVGIVECEAVVQSDAGKLFGISNIVYGFFFFGAVAALSFATILSRAESTAKLRRASLIVVSIGVLYALYLFFFQVIVLGQFCKLCLTTGLTTATLFGVHAVEWAGKSVPRFDLSEMVREVGVFLLMIFLAGLLLVAELLFLNQLGTLEYGAANAAAMSTGPSTSIVEPSPGVSSGTVPADEPGSAEDAQIEVRDGADNSGNESGGEPPAETGDGAVAEAAESSDAQTAQDQEDAELKAQLDMLCQFDETMPSLPDVDGLIRNAPSIGSESAEVVMIEFFDPNCPHCKTLHQNTPQIMDEVGDRVRLHYRPYPIWPYSYNQVEALYLAEDQGMFKEMLDAQMTRQKPGGLSIEELADIAEDIGMDEDEFRSGLNGGKYRSRVNRERVQIARLGVRAVPKLTIDGQFLQSRSVNPACIDHLVEKVEMGG